MSDTQSLQLPAPVAAPVAAPAPVAAAATAAVAATAAAQVEADAVVASGAFIPGEPEYELDPLLTRILRTRRRHGSNGDLQFRMWLFNYIKTQLGLKPIIKEEGCIYVTTSEKSTVLFSSHVDTVHNTQESNACDQSLAFDPVFGHLFLADKSKSSCLGGDDGVGIYLMLKMLDKRVPGHYVFHTGEEVGGVGSTALVKANTKFIDEIEAVVAFDRKCIDGEDNEVIITQGGTACASETFGLALAKALSDPKWEFANKWVTSHKGTFTDSKNYAYLVPECVNLGCFYDRQHTSSETVNVYELDKLVNAITSIEWHMLPIVRKPTVYTKPAEQKQDYQYGFGNFEGHGRWPGQGQQAQPQKQQPKAKPKVQQAPETDLVTEVELLDTYRMVEIEDLAAALDGEELPKFLALLALELRKLRAERDGLLRMLDLDR